MFQTSEKLNFNNLISQKTVCVVNSKILLLIALTKLLNVSISSNNQSYKIVDNVRKTEYCAVQLNEEKYKAFVYAVKNHYWYQMYIDDLPIWGVVGEVKESNYYIWTHKKFEIGYNGKQIIDVNLTSEDKVLLTPTTKLNFTYEVIWRPTDIKYEDRFDKYLDHNFFQHRVSFFYISATIIMY